MESSKQPDVIGRPLSDAEAILKAANVHYEVMLTRPPREFFQVDGERLYVVRQVFSEDGVCRLLTAAAQKGGEM